MKQMIPEENPSLHVTFAMKEKGIDVSKNWEIIWGTIKDSTGNSSSLGRLQTMFELDKKRRGLSYDFTGNFCLGEKTQKINLTATHGTSASVELPGQAIIADIQVPALSNYPSSTMKFDLEGLNCEAFTVPQNGIFQNYRLNSDCLVLKIPSTLKTRLNPIAQISDARGKLVGNGSSWYQTNAVSSTGTGALKFKDIEQSENWSSCCFTLGGPPIQVKGKMTWITKFSYYLFPLRNIKPGIKLQA